MKVYKSKIDKNKLYSKYTNLLNGLLALSGKEMEVFSILLQINEEQKPILGKKQDILSTDNRRLIMEATNINKNNLSKYIAVLKDKRIILKDDKGHYINNVYLPNIVDGVIEVLFIVEVNNENDNN